MVPRHSACSHLPRLDVYSTSPAIGKAQAAQLSGRIRPRREMPLSQTSLETLPLFAASFYYSLYSRSLIEALLMRRPLLVGFLLLPSMLSAQHRAADEVALAPRPRPAPVAVMPVHPGTISAPAPRPTPAPIAPIAVRPATAPSALPNRVAPLRPQPSR